jgi:beta-phosphoglucomutase-like phosphatase (HAD superfamily)
MKSFSTPAAVIFDMDGLLFDSEALYQRAIALAAAEGNHDLRAASPLMIGRPVVQSRLILLEHHGPSFPVDAFFESMFRHFDRLAATDLALKPGVLELLDTLDQLQLPRAIATSSGHPRVQAHLDLHQLGGRFHAIVGHGDYAASKPAPDAFLLAAKRLGGLPQRGAGGACGGDDDGDGAGFDRSDGGVEGALQLCGAGPA